MTEIEREVLQLVVDQTGVRADKVTLETRLLHDIGMEGDDAVEFFAAVRERFGTDLDALEADWARHFGPEPGCLTGAAIVPGAAVGAAIAIALGLPDFWGALLAVATGVASIWAMTRFSGEPKAAPVTVADVAAAVAAGAWPKRERP
ncbi:MAG: hypothetical protein V4574_06860 [Pseudomonadota bacterium]